jgi:Mn2+/Fe2+ NRAMP family transporter
VVLFDSIIEILDLSTFKAGLVVRVVIVDRGRIGAAFGYAMLWTIFFTYPLMVGIQIVSARIARVTGHGLAANIRKCYPRSLLCLIVGLLLVANTINIAADIGAMGAALKLLIGGSAQVYAVFFAVVSLLLQIFVPFPRYSPILKLLTLTLFAYVGTIFVVRVPWDEVIWGTLLPKVTLDSNYVTAMVAIFGTSISPYLFFWQASQEVEELRAAPGEAPLNQQPSQARTQLARIQLDTYVGMGFSNVVAFFIMLTTAVTLHTPDLLHPCCVRVGRDAGDLDQARREFDDKQNVIGRQALQAPNFDSEEV